MASKVRRRTPKYRARRVVDKTFDEFGRLERKFGSGHMQLSFAFRAAGRLERKMWERVYSQAVAQTSAEMKLDQKRRKFLHEWAKPYARELGLAVSHLHDMDPGGEGEFTQSISMPDERNPLTAEERTKFKGRYVKNLNAIMEATLSKMKRR